MVKKGRNVVAPQLRDNIIEGGGSSPPPDKATSGASPGAILVLLDLTVELRRLCFNLAMVARQGKGGGSILLVDKMIAGEGVYIEDNTQCDTEGLQTDSILN
jgi:hypothetical protein